MNTVANDKDDLYRAAVGEEKEHYYLPHFHDFDNGDSRATWNWPALFVTFFWLLYRRMYGYAVAYLLLLPLVLAIVGALLSYALGQIGAVAYLILAIAVPWVVMPTYANALYHAHVNKRIQKTLDDAPSREAAVQRLIGEKSSAGLVVGIAAVGGVAIIGILAAVAIPAYQDYTIRAQVSEGLMLAAPVRATITEHYDTHGQWLAVMDINTPPPQGKYVTSVDISNGLVLIHYGNAANRSLAGRTVALRPAASPNGEVTWVCGYARNWDGTSGADITDVPAKYLPSDCRPEVADR